MIAGGRYTGEPRGLGQRFGLVRAMFRVSVRVGVGCGRQVHRSA